MGLWKTIAQSTNDGFIQAIANEDLGRYYKRTAQIGEASAWFSKMQAVLLWSVIGPFENVAASGFDEVYFPEKQFIKNERGKGRAGIPVSWFDVTTTRIDSWIDFESLFDNRRSVYYANNFVFSPKKQIVQLRIGTSGSFKVFLNDSAVLTCNKERNNDLDTYIAEVTLNEGWNRLLVKNCYSEISNCNFLFRITDEKGFPHSDLKYTTEEKTYTHGYTGAIRSIASRYEEYFLRAIQQHPEFPENYILLSDLYCLNDKVEDANDILLKGLTLFHDNPFFLNKLNEVYLRSGKRTELLTNYRKLEEINPNFVGVLGVNASLAYQNKNNTEYARILSKLIEILPDGVERDIFRISDLGLKNKPKEIIALVDSMYERYPDNWQVIKIKSSIDYTINRSFENLLAIVKKYVAKRIDGESLNQLAQIYINLNRPDDYEKTMQLMHELEPASPSYYFAHSKTYFTWQKYDRAEELIKKALALCPSCSSYLEFLGDIYKAQGKLDECRLAYHQGLVYLPTKHSLREKLNSISPESAAEKLIRPLYSKELLRKMDDASSPTGEDVYVVLNDSKRRIFPEGSSEVEATLLFKILSRTGIQQMSEYTVHYFENEQDFIFDKAVVIKKDGSEIPADRDDSHFVFKSLDVNDYILIKYKIQNHFSGSLADHFWDEFLISNWYPVHTVRYSLICPENQIIRYKGQNFDATPTLDTVVEHERLLSWEMKDIPGIRVENNMPELVDIGKVLYLSSLPDWNFLSNWYNKISRSRLEATQEIKEKVASLFDKAQTYSDREKARIIYNYITKNITYSSVSFRQSGIIPQKAKDVLVSKLGDCKDLTGLFIAMAKEVGLQASYVLLNTRNEGKYENVLPGLYFNHAIASVTLDNTPYLLDLTSKYSPFLSQPVVDIQALCLPVSEKGNDRSYTTSNGIVNAIYRKVTGEITADNALQVHFQNASTGELAADLRAAFLDKDSTEQLKTLNDHFSDISTNLKIVGFTIYPQDLWADTVYSTEDIIFNSFLTSTGNFRLLKLPWVDHITGNDEISLEKRNFPLESYQEANSIITEISIQLPKGYSPVELPEDLKTSFQNKDYSISFSYKDGIIFAKETMQFPDATIQPEHYAEYRAFCNSIIEAENKQILLKKK